jgi:hypothetical protein
MCSIKSIKGVGDKTQSFSFVTDPFNSDTFNFVQPLYQGRL